MAAKTTPWWRRAVQFVLKGIRAVVRMDSRARRVADEVAFNELDAYTSLQNEAEERTLTHDSRSTNSTPEIEEIGQGPTTAEKKPVVRQPAETTDSEIRVSEPVELSSSAEPAKPPALVAEAPEAVTDLLAETALGKEASAESNVVPAADSDLLIAPAGVPAETRNEPVAEASEEVTQPKVAPAPDTEATAQEVHPAPALAMGSEASALEVPETEIHEPEAPETANSDAFPGETIEETTVTPKIQSETTAAGPNLDETLESAAEAVLELEPEAPHEPVTEPEVAAEQPTETPAETPALEPQAAAGAKPEETQPELSAQSVAPEPAATAAAQPEAASSASPVPREPIRKEEGPDTSPVSVVVNQVYEGPFDLLLDLIRRQDIDIYDIPIARITAQFLTYVDRLKASDMDVAGEFIYTASLLIHIKSKMLLPRNPAGPGEEQEDPRRELVERLLEHERFKNAAQMLQQKQMLESASWTNPGMREFREDAGAEPEVAADTVDLVRIFREILERARSRPILNVQEDSVTVGQMIQFLGRRLTMEDKPVALRRLLAHTKSERALIAMFLALLELVRLQAILLRQDRHFSEIFIKKNAGFEAVLNEGLARDDWQ